MYDQANPKQNRHIGRRTRPGVSWYWTPLVTMVAMLAVGCARQVSLAEVEGTVYLDGNPLDNVLVCFLPDPAKGTAGPRSVAATDAQGHYRLRCDDRGEGAVIGWHRVVVEDLAPYVAPRDEKTSPGQTAPSRVPSAYTTSANTPLSIEIKPDRQTVNLDLRSGR